MLILYFFILLSFLIGIKYRSNLLNTEYLSLQQCNAIKGIFILMVFMRHILQYICGSHVIGEAYDISGFVDYAGILVDNNFGQLIVTLFLFYSGFGVMESTKLRGNDYVRKIPQHRIVPTLLNFDIAVLLFLILNIVLGIHYDVYTILLSLSGWKSIGNSNWYIFDILFCYLLFYLVRCFCQFIGANVKIFITILFLIFIITLYVISRFKVDIWYNTLFCFPFGVLWSINKERFEKIIYNHYNLYILLFTILFVFLHLFPYDILGGKYNVKSIIFCTIIVMITMKIKIGNRCLYWLGHNLFPLYIYQRIPMIALNELSGGILPTHYPYLYIAISLLLTIMIAYFYHYWQIKDQSISKRIRA